MLTRGPQGLGPQEESHALGSRLDVHTELFVYVGPFWDPKKSPFAPPAAGINFFWSIKNSNEVLNKFKYKNFKASKLSTYDFSTLYTTIPHHLIKETS